jgi:HlyD family secretion protein
MVFKVRARIDPALLAQYRDQVKTGLPGLAYVRLAADQPWPERLGIKLPPVGTSATASGS